MKRLYLLRHAKSKLVEDGGGDFDRALAPRGRRNAPIMAGHMRTKGYLPALILGSSARRSRETLDLVLPALAPDVEIEFDRQLYLTSSIDLLRLIHQQPDAAGSILIVGHNPGLQQLAVGLAQAGDGPALRRMCDKFPTLALAILEFDCKHWRAVTWGHGSLIDFVVPADFD
ncbi:MAG: SixA phosphatase family protein [Dongiaceae bacterium]